MNAAEALAEIKSVVDPFEFLVHLEKLSNLLAIRQIVAQRDTISLVHPSNRHSDWHTRSLSNRRVPGRNIEDSNPCSGRDIGPRHQHPRKGCGSTLGRYKKIDSSGQ